MAANRASHFCSLDLDGIKNKVKVRDMESLFKKTMGEDAVLLHYRILARDPYASKMLKTVACVKTTGCTIWKLSLMTKMNFALRYHQIQFIDTSGAFSKEIFFYETLIPAYEKLYCNEGKFKISPKYYGGRCALNENEPDDNLYDDAVLLTENIKIRGYYSAQEYYGLDFEHAKMAITALARFHALGMAVKEKMPELFAVAKSFCNVTYDFEEKYTEKIIDLMTDIVGRPGLPNELDKDIIANIKMNMQKNNWSAWLPPSENVEPWVTVIHGNYSIETLLFHNTLEGVVDDAKIIDFELAKIGSPQADLIYFVCVNLDLETQQNHFDELIDMYFDKLIETLRATDVDTFAFSKESFDQHLKTVAKTELFHCLMGLKWATLSIGYSFLEIEYLRSMFHNELFRFRSRLTALTFVEKDWL